MKIVRTNSENVGFIELVSFLDQDLAERDGDDHSFYAQFNKIDTIKHTVLAYENNKIVGRVGALINWIEVKEFFKN